MDEISNIILENEDLIYSIAHKFNYGSIEDLFQVGCIGMLEAYKNYDKTRGVKFTTYAYPYIFGQISNFIREDKNIKISSDLTKLKNKISKAKEILTQKLMREPTILELSEFSKIDVQNLEYIINYNPNCDSLDKCVYDDVSLYEHIGNNTDYDTLIALKCEFERLEEPEKSIMINRYFKDMTQTEIGNILGISQVDVSRKEKKVLKRLRKTLN